MLDRYTRHMCTRNILNAGLLPRFALGWLACVLLGWSSTARAQDVGEYYAIAAATLSEPARDALSKIDTFDRKLLALRSYLRTYRNLNERWSWTETEIRAYNRSQQQRNTVAEVERIKARFAAQNPGYELHVNTQVRSLDAQIANWNANRKVGEIAQRIEIAAAEELTRDIYPPEPDREAIARFIVFLKGWVPKYPAPLAAPGLSRHGQARAFDFSIRRGDKIIAGTETARIATAWDGPGWTEKLRRAVMEASDKFSGPLEYPREPWHYEYDTDPSLVIATGAAR